MNKTIYVSDEDLPLFEAAQRLFGGNLSAVIAHALRMFVDSRTRATPRYEETAVVVGDSNNRRLEKFLGRHVADWRHLDSQGTALLFSVYHTQGHQWALYRRRAPLTPIEEAWSGRPADHSWLHDAPTLDVYENLPALKQVIPTELSLLVDRDPYQLPVVERDI